MTEKTDAHAVLSNQGKLSFLDDFPAHTYQEWRAAAEASLKGASFDRKLVSRTNEGIELQPLYHRQGGRREQGLPGAPPYLRGGAAMGYVETPWAICQELGQGTPSSFNAAVRHDLSQGLDALGILLDDSTRLCPPEVPERSATGGLALSSPDDFRVAFADLLWETPVHVFAGATALPFLAQVAALLPEGDPRLSQVKGCVGADPLGEQARLGGLPCSLASLYDQMAATTRWAAEACPDVQTVLVQGCPYHEAGGSATQEVAFALATGVDYVRALQERQLTPSASGRRFRFSFSLGRNFFMEVAKLRAARLLWARIVEAFGGDVPAQRMVIHGRTSRWTKSALDPMVNQLRNTTEALAAVVGGVDSLHVRPFDEPLGRPSRLAQRLARNIQLLLLHESHLDWPIDPAGGSWLVESLTDELAEQAWQLFQQVEGQGGMAASLAAGFPQAEVARVAQQRRTQLETGREVMVGTNLYPNVADAVEINPGRTRSPAAPAPAHPGPVSQPPEASQGAPELVQWAIEQARQGASLAAILAGMTAGPEGGARGEPGPPLEVHRGSEPYERLRRAARSWADPAGGIKVFLASVGPLAQHVARTDFAANFFLIGGFEVVRGDGWPTAVAAAQAAGESAAPIVVICSSDRAYPDVVPELTRTIKEQRPATTVLLAGKPAAELEPTYREAGLDGAIHLGANCFTILESLQRQQGVTHE